MPHPVCTRNLVVLTAAFDGNKIN